MEFLKSIKNILSDIGSNVYRIVIKFICYALVLLLVGFCATRCTKAMIITDNLRTIPESQLTMLKNIAERNNYKYYVITSDYISSGYNNYTNYYLCLTNEELDITTPNFLETTCEKIYRYTNNSNNYSLGEVVDKEFKLSNVTYYTDYNSSKQKVINIMLVITLIGGIYLLLQIIFRIL